MSQPTFAQALRLHQAGHLAEAEQLYRQVLAADGAHADSLHLLGVIAYQQGRMPEASDLIGQALSVNDAAPSYHANLGLVRRAEGRLDEAEACQRRALALMPDYPEAHNNLGLVLQEQARGGDAVLHFRRALALRPDLPEAHNNLANVLEEQGRLDEAEAACARALELRPDFPEALNSMGVIRTRQDDIRQAADFYRRAIALKPDFAEAHVNLGHALKSLGRFDEAQAAYRRALGGDAATARHGLGFCRKITEANDPLITETQDALKNPELSDKDRVLLHFALGKIFDDLGAPARAIAHFDEGNRLETSRHPFDAPAFAARIDRLMQDDVCAPSPAASNSELPILIVGMPRSGTTLVEQILASHPSVAAGGERSFWLQRAEAIGKAPQPATAEAAAVKDYLALLTGIGPKATRVTDKMPYNFLNIGLIRRLFPKARIIHCRRHPLDNALSLYFSRFARVHEYAYDRADIAHYYRDYQRLMEHWRRALLPPECFLEIDYEQLVSDQEPVTRRLLEFCGLPWDAACLDFFRTERPIGTLSAWQARQPLYRGAMERWRRYEPWLGELESLRPE